MKIYTWDDSLKIGIPKIDQQHKQLIDQMNVLAEALQENKAKAEILQILSFLDRYVNEHFSYEEGCMMRYHCPAAVENCQAHAHFKTTLQEIREEVNKQGTSLATVLKVNQALLSWLIHHIRKIDTQLAPCVK